MTLTRICPNCHSHSVHTIKNWGKGHLIIQCQNCGEKTKVRR